MATEELAPTLGSRMVAEAEHKKGEEGVRLAKRYLEATTFVNITFTAYDDQNQMSLRRLDDSFKRYDMAGFFLGDNKRPLFVEVKNYDAVGGQSEGYSEFLCDAYSTLTYDLEVGVDRKIDFMWATWHPFDQTKWSKLTSFAEIKRALGKKIAADPQFLGGRPISEDNSRMLSERLWLIPLHRRLEELAMTRDELFEVHRSLKRKGLF